MLIFIEPWDKEDEMPPQRRLNKHSRLWVLEDGNPNYLGSNSNPKMAKRKSFKRIVPRKTLKKRWNETQRGQSTQEIQPSRQFVQSIKAIPPFSVTRADICGSEGASPFALGSALMTTWNYHVIDFVPCIVDKWRRNSIHKITWYKYHHGTDTKDRSLGVSCCCIDHGVRPLVRLAAPLLSGYAPNYPLFISTRLLLVGWRIYNWIGDSLTYCVAT